MPPRAAATAPSSCSAEAEPTVAIVSVVRVLDLQRVALAGDALAADQEQRVAHAAEPALETGSRPVASALRPASSVSSGRTSASFSARRCCQVTKIIARTVTANSNVAIE